MELIDNKSKLLGDDLKREITKGASVRMVASYFSIYAFEALKDQNNDPVVAPVNGAFHNFVINFANSLSDISMST